MAASPGFPVFGALAGLKNFCSQTPGAYCLDDGEGGGVIFANLQKLLFSGQYIRIENKCQLF
jgi:hypothetical protein